MAVAAFVSAAVRGRRAGVSSCVLGIVLGVVGFATAAPAQPAGPLVSDRLLIQGTRLSIAPGDEAQVLNVAESASVRTCFAGVCGGMAAGDSRVAGLVAQGELSGPELPAPLTYSAVPGGAFLVPGFQAEGTYVLSNIRLVRAGTGEVLGSATPSAVVLEVRQILLSSATIRQLSLEELKARGIEITQQSFQAFNFAVGFAFSDQPVTIEFPVLFHEGGQVDLLTKPQVKLDELPGDVAAIVRRWQPPHLIPFKLEAAGRDSLEPGQEAEELPPDSKLFGVIVLPGNVSFLNQFFDAQLLVANGAPVGSGAVLANVTGAIRLPAAVPRELLRLARTTPSVVAGQRVPVLGATGGGRLGPGEQGAASFTLEGLVAGTHVVTMEIGADLERPGRQVLPLTGKLKAAVEVVDARFNLSFNHPDVVREGEPYTLFVTVTNLSRATQNLVTVELDPARITGAHKERPGDDFSPTIPTLAPGEGATLEYRLVADVTGRCVATTFQAAGPLEGVIRLRTGVGEAGIPLSPSSLVLPRFTEQLPEALVRANVRLLGLAWSLAVAPPGSIPPELPRLIASDVERRAVDLAEAGQRLYLGEELLPSLEALVLDQLGNRHDLPEFDQLRRSLSKGRDAAEALAVLVRQEQEARGLSATALLDDVASTMSWARPWLGATLQGAGSGHAPTLEVRRLNGVSGVTYLAYPAGDERALRSLPFGEVFDVLDGPGGGRAPLAVVGRLSAAAGYALVVHGPTSGPPMPVTLSFVVPAAAGDGFVRVDFPPLAVPPGQAWAVETVHAAGDPRPLTFALVHLGTGIPVAGAPAPAVRSVDLPPFRLIGARQDFVLDPYGSGVWYLFNRPPARADAENESRFEVETRFRGLDTTTSGTTLERGTTFSAASALWQPSSERVVTVRFAQPVSAVRATHDGQPVVTHVHLLDVAGIRDAWGSPLANPLPEIRIEDDHVGGLVEGKVLRGTGEAVAGATVRLVRDRVIQSKDGLDGRVVHDLVAEQVTDSEGAFFFPFIEEPILPVPRPPEKGPVQSGFRIQALVPPGPDPLAPEEREEVSSVIRLQSRLARINIALLGRGTVAGHVLYDDGAPVASAAVTAASTLFSEVLSAVAGADGAFRIDGLPVGPITLTARDAAGHSAYATVALATPGATANVTLHLPRAEATRTGTVTGQVLARRETPDGPIVGPAAGASVAVYSAGAPYGHATTGPGGAFRFEGIPAGRVTVQAADFSISRTAAIVDLDLAPDATADVTLTIAASTSRAVTGRVLFRDPFTQTDVAVAGATVFVEGPGSFALTDGQGDYRIDDVPAQGVGDRPYRVHAIDFARMVEGTTLVAVTDASPDPVVAATILLRGSSSGALDGVVLDPLGRPAPGVTVTVLPIGETTTRADGTFSLEDVPVRRYTVSAHKGTGLEPGAIGWIGATGTEVLFGGHRAFATVRLRGAGTVNVRTRTASAGIMSPLSYKPTWFSPQELVIRQKVAGIETTTDEDGRLTLVLPVGELSISASNPFHGTASFGGSIDFAGQVKEVDLLFEEASTVAGYVVDVDGVTPVPGIDVDLDAAGLLPQRQRTNELGAFRFELVPPGGVSVTARGMRGAIERTGRTYGRIVEPGQTLDLVVRLKPQGTVRGRVVDETAPGEIVPLAGAQVALQENEFPFRRFPAAPGYLSAGSDGRFEFPAVAAGRFTVIARDPGQVSRQGSRFGELKADFEVVDVGDLALSGQVGALIVLVRDPENGSPVPDAQVFLSNGEATVAGADGRASFAALPLGTWSVHAFHAPTGRCGRLDEVRLLTAGQEVEAVVVLDQRGRISGRLFDDAAWTVPVGGGTVRLQGTVNGRLWGAGVTALATTSRDPEALGRFAFDGLPVATYSLTAGIEGSSRQAAEIVTLTPTAPEAEVALVLEPVREVWVRLYEKRQAAGLVELNPDFVSGDGIFAVSYGRQISVFGVPIPLASLLAPDVPYPGHAFLFGDVLAARSFWLQASESTGERRRALVTSSALSSGASGAGTSVDPYRIVLLARGTVRVTVRDAGGVAAAGATVRVHAPNGTWETAADSSGRAVFTAVEEGQVTVSAFVPGTPFGASASRRLQWDDEVLDVELTLSPVVSAHGTVYEAPEGDAWDGNPASLAPAAGVVVRLRPSAGDEQLLITGIEGTYAFSGLAPGPYTIEARSVDGEKVASAAGTLGSAHGSDYALPLLVLDGSRPQIVSLTPPNGASLVSRTAPVEIVFSEPLAPAVLPSGPTSTYFKLAFSGTPASGAWSSALDTAGRQVVRFTPSPRYENSTTYSLVVKGGPVGVRDREGRPLTDSGDVGASFTTSDTDGPRVVGTVPPLARPVDPGVSIRIDFGEVLVLTPAQLQSAVLFEWKATTGIWTSFPVTTSLTRGGYSVLVEQPQGVTFTDDSLRRRLTVTGLTDAFGNPMPAWVGEYRIYDTNAPVLTIGLPPNAPGGDLFASSSYVLAPEFDEPDDWTPESPWGDVDRVEYTFASAADPTEPASAPGAVLTVGPFKLSFVAAYVGDGSSPRPFPVWVKAFDTSGNPSAQVRLDMRVLPNASPTIGSLSVAATAPVVGTIYAGSSVAVTATGISDADDARLTLVAELRRGAGPQSTLIASVPARVLDRPAEGWAALPAQTFSFVVPLTEPEGSTLSAVVRATDGRGAAGTVDLPFTVADDSAQPLVTDLVARRPDGTTSTSFVIGDSFVLEVRVRDLETAVRAVSVATTGGVFPETLEATRVGTSDLFRTASVTVPSTLTEPVSVVVTAIAEDHGGNDRSATLSLEAGPALDPTHPVAEWLSPFDGALWPADYASVDPGKNGVDLLLRLRVTDRNVDGAGQDVPGDYVAVKLRGPVDATGVLAEEWTTAALLSGSAGEWWYEAVWRVPNGIPAGTSLPFEVEVVDSGANRIERRTSIVAVPARHVYESATTAVGSTSDVPKPAGSESHPVFLLDGTTLSLYPPEAGGGRSFEGLFLYSGGAWSSGPGSAVTVRRTVLTSPEVTSPGSLVPYYPLELEIGATLAVAHGAAIDVSGRGLLGGRSSHDPIVIPGERASVPGAAASHGGMGHPTNGDWLALLLAPGSVYGNIRDPRLPGGGGGRTGGSGGGVVRIDAPTATVRLFGDLLANGGPVPSGGYNGAAGGSVRLRAQRLEGRGAIRAIGSSASTGTARTGGGGGRVSVTWAEPEILSVAVRADGAPSQLSGASTPLAGAGTVFLERLDVTGLPVDRGLLRVSNPASSDPPAITPLPGLGSAAVTAVDAANRVVTVSAAAAVGSIEGEGVVVSTVPAGGGSPTSVVLPVTSQVRTAGSVGSPDQAFALTVDASTEALGALAAALSAGDSITAKARLRFAAFEASGPVRVASGDELEIGGVVDDRAVLTIQSGARVLLGESPVVDFAGTVPTPGASVAQGSEVEIRFRVQDPLGVSAVQETWGATGSTSTRTFVEPLEVQSSAWPIRFTIPAGHPAGPVSFTVRATDRAGRVTESTATWNVLGDTVPPVITAIDLSPQRPADTYVAGDTITVTARATDDVKLARIRIEVDGRVAESTTSPATLAWLTSPVAATSSYTLTVTATDLAGLEKTETKTIAVEPRPDTAAPVVSFVCPSPGALFPSGYENLTLQATASDDLGVQRVELYRDAETEPLAVVYATAGTTKVFEVSAPGIVVPEVTQPTTVAFRVRAIDFGGNASAEVETEVTVVPAVEILASGPNDWPALETQTAYLASGTLVLDQPRKFGNLLVLRGASITHVAGGGGKVDLDVTGTLFVDCGGAIDVTEKGYPGGASYSGESESTDAGGSHLGTGGAYGAAAKALTYGSVERPREAGGGGWGGSMRPGGGVVRIEAGSVVLGGPTARIVANGGGGDWRAGAGGSIWITAGTVSGDGLIEAAGGASYRQGGGGAVAVEYGEATGTVLTRANARGIGGRSTAENGGAGTVFLKGPGQAFGTLRVDDRGTVGQATVLPSLGSGTAQAGTSGATLVTGRVESVPPYFAGHWVEVRREGSLLGSWRVGTISDRTVTLEPNEAETIVLQPGDLWQGVYRFDAVELGGESILRSDDPIRTGTTTVFGNVTVDRVTSTTLTVKAGATLTHAASTAGNVRSLDLSVSGTLTIEADGAIDVTEKGYPGGASYSGESESTDAGGSHLGTGGVYGAAAKALTYGSVERPREAGGGGWGGSMRPGGGVVRIEAGSVVLGGPTARIVANGGGGDWRAGAGGSIWITAGTVSGDGLIEAAGGASYRQGGGGAVAVEYGEATGTVLTRANARGIGGRSTAENGGAGTVFLKGPGQAFGTLRVDNGGTVGQKTVLPSLGTGVAQAGTAGATLVTNRAESIPAYFVGHWVEIRREGSLLGSWRIGTISDRTVTLEPNEAETIEVQPGDLWQGVYRFDAVEVLGGAGLSSADPVRIVEITLSGPTTPGSYTEVTVPLTAETVTVTGNVSIPGVTSTTLTVKAGATLTHAASTAGNMRSLDLSVSGTLTIEADGAIDATEKGYPGGTSYSGEPESTDAGGSHLGTGGAYGAAAKALTYGSVERPREAGGGGWGGSMRPGGGVVRIEAGSVVLGGPTARIVANGGGGDWRAGAGGSIWITAGTVSGDGLIEAAGGASYRQGGGGAVAIEYGAATGTVLTRANARGIGGRSTAENGGAGTVFLKGPGQAFGTLRVDDRGTVGQATVLPSLGSGTAQAGTSGATLVTGRVESVPPYFAGHWVEVRREGSLLGSWRVGTISDRTVTLEPNDAETIVLQPGDLWQGVYRFDAVELGGESILRSDDPIRAGTTTVFGNVTVDRVTSTTLTVKAGATLTHAASTAGNVRSLDLSVSGTLTIEASGAIDVTEKGYPGGTSYTGESESTDAGGSHLGTGGAYGAAAKALTYGSVERPREAGGGGWGGSMRPGGGVVRIEAGSVVLGGPTARIMANGGGGDWRAGAGGSIWITAGTVSGDGLIEAAGGASYRQGGGGAVAIEYGEATGTALTRANARGAGGRSTAENGGAGTVFLKGPGQAFGTLRVDNGGTVGQKTVLPSLGTGVAQAGTAGATLVTNRAESIPAYFVGHWVEIRREGSLIGSWRVGTISDRTVTLEANEAETIELQPGDLWQSVYRFDAVVETGNAILESADPVRDGPPTISISSPQPGASFPSGSVIPVSFSVADDKGVTKVTFSFAGRTVEVAGPNPTTAVLPVPWLSANTVSDLVATVHDTSGQAVSRTVPLTVLGAPPLSAEIASPTEGESIWGGSTLTVRVDVPDRRPIRRVQLSFGSVTEEVLSVVGPYIWLSLSVPEVSEDETRTITATVEDDLGTTAISEPVTVHLLADSAPIVTSSVNVESPVSAGSSVEVAYSATIGNSEGAQLRLEVTGAVTWEETVTFSSGSSKPGGVAVLDSELIADGSFSPFEIPEDARGPMTITVTAIDGEGRTGTAPEIVLEVVEPETLLTLTLPGSNVVSPGETVELTLTAAEEIGAGTEAMLLVEGAGYQRLITLRPDGPGEGDFSWTVRVPVPKWTLGEVTAQAEADLGDGEYSASNMVTFTVEDTTDPVVTRIRTAPEFLRGGSTVSFAADVTDAGAISEVRFAVDGVHFGTTTYLQRQNSYEVTGFPLPSVVEARLLTVSVEAVDATGNIGTASSVFTLLPAGTPGVRLAAPTAGAMTIAGGVLRLLAEVEHDRDVVEVAFFREGEGAAFATLPGGERETDYIVPAEASAGTSIGFRVEIRDDLGAVGTASASVLVVEGDVLEEGSIVAAGDLSHEDRTVVVRGATEIRGPHRFARLVVLRGGSVTGAATTEGATGGVDLEITGDAYVALGGVIHTSGRGFEGGLQGTNGTPVGLTAAGLPGAADGAGGSHGGTGEPGSGEEPGPVYGSIREPATPGSGGGADGASSPGGSGGGVIRLTVGGRLVVDGELSASGYDGDGGGAGSGGSISVDADSLGGSGLLHAVGGSPWPRAGAGGSAGGGRIAIRSPLDVRPPSLSAASGSQWFASGAPGTVFLSSPGDRNGHLVVDSGWCEQPRPTRLVEVGEGVVSSASGTAFRGQDTQWKSGLEGQFVEFERDDARVGEFRIVTVDEAGQEITLDEEAHGQIRPGDTYRGLHFFDSITVAGRARLATTDTLDGWVFLDPAAGIESRWMTEPPFDAAPTVTATVPSREVTAGETLPVSVTTGDGSGLDRIVVWILGDEGSRVEVPLAGSPTADERTVSFTLPAGLAAGEQFLGVGVYDGAGQWSSTLIRLEVTGAPGLRISSPAKARPRHGSLRPSVHVPQARHSSRPEPARPGSAALPDHRPLPNRHR